MESKLKSPMEKHTKRGYTIVEMVLILTIISTFTTYSFNRVNKQPQYHRMPLSCQIEAMTKRKTCVYTNGLTFNENGNINRGQTLKINNVICIFQIGMGRYACE